MTEARRGCQTLVVVIRAATSSLEQMMLVQATASGSGLLRFSSCASMRLGATYAVNYKKEILVGLMRGTTGGVAMDGCVAMLSFIQSCSDLWFKNTDLGSEASNFDSSNPDEAPPKFRVPQYAHGLWITSRGCQEGVTESPVRIYVHKAS
ncbi:hypothetical protein BJV78DRAFT_1157113 [Lactifluus subvellereus]|nr:hypothetical protein BJV78DRAFT_1157113 [Lactifluus subvellereus]